MGRGGRRWRGGREGAPTAVGTCPPISWGGGQGACRWAPGQGVKPDPLSSQPEVSQRHQLALPFPADNTKVPQRVLPTKATQPQGWPGAASTQSLALAMPLGPVVKMKRPHRAQQPFSLAGPITRACARLSLTHAR